jgi:hypothetical protein
MKIPGPGYPNRGLLRFINKPYIFVVLMWLDYLSNPSLLTSIFQATGSPRFNRRISDASFECQKHLKRLNIATHWGTIDCKWHRSCKLRVHGFVPLYCLSEVGLLDSGNDKQYICCHGPREPET